MSGNELNRVAAVAVVAVAFLAQSAPNADTRPSRRDADLLKQKVTAIAQLGANPVKQARRTKVTEDEVNAYLALDARNDLPAGVVDPSVMIMGTGRLSGRAVVDLDAVRKQSNPKSLLDPRSYLMGRLPVTATGTLKTSNGVAHFELESATVGGVPLPKLLLQEILTYYSRTPENPAGINLDDPFMLPARIREIQVERGHAIIVQ